jgi:hypothetical protein
MRTALAQLLSDFLSAIVFLTIYGSTENLYLATGAAIAVSLAQFTASMISGRHVDAMQWLVLGMVVVLGSATLITQDSRVVMAKPSLAAGRGADDPVRRHRRHAVDRYYCPGCRTGRAIDIRTTDPPSARVGRKVGARLTVFVGAGEQGRPNSTVPGP